jgi:hypothetical protein
MGLISAVESPSGLATRANYARIPNLSHLSHYLNCIAADAQVAASPNQQRALAKGLEACADVIERAQRRTAQIDPEFAEAGQRKAKEAIDSAAESIQGLQNAICRRPDEPKEQFLQRLQGTDWGAFSKNVRAASQVVKDAEVAAKAAGGPGRDSPRPNDPRDLAIPDNALKDAWEDPALARALSKKKLRAQKIVRLLGPRIGKIGRGKVEVMGTENLPKSGHYILVPTHQSFYMDGPVWLSFLGKYVKAPLRPMMGNLSGREGVLGKAGPALNRAATMLGAFLVTHGAEDHGNSALAAGVQMCIDKENPQIPVVFGGRMLEQVDGADLLRGTGAVRIAIAASKALGEDVQLVPVAIVGVKGGAKGDVVINVGKAVSVWDKASAKALPESAHNVELKLDELQENLCEAYEAARPSRAGDP